MIYADEIDERRRLNAIFKKLMEQKAIQDKYEVDPESMNNITKGKQSTNKYIKAMALAIEDVYKALKQKKEDCQRTGKEYTGVLEEAELKTIYKKNVSPLV